MRPVSRTGRVLLRLIAPRDHREALLDDLEEEAASILARDGLNAARHWSRGQIAASLLPLFLERLHTAGRRSRSTCMSLWRGLRSDVLLAARRLVKTPGFSLICILTLAVGIGGNAAIFTLIDRVVLKPLPVPRPSELYRLGDGNQCCVNTGLQGSFSLFSYELYTQLRDAAPEFTDVAAFQANVRTMTIGRPEGDRPAETVNSAFVSGNYFRTFAVVPAAGRLITPADDVRGAAPVAVLSYRAWRDRFQRRTDIFGAPLTLNGASATIVGVAAEGFYGDTLRPDPAEVWVPLAAEPLVQPSARLLESRGSHWLYALGRLERPVPTASIDAHLTVALQQFLKTLDLPPDDMTRVAQQRITVVPAGGGVNSMRREAAPALNLLQVMAAAVLLIACANLANLLLARGLGRRNETAVRVALGAPRARLIAHSLVESLLLAIVGGAAGILLSVAAAQAIVGMAFRGASDIPFDPSPSALVLAAAFGVSLLTGLIFGAAPAIAGSRSDPIDAMRGAGRTTGDGGTRMRQGLIAVQVAISLVLITCAGLLGRSLRHLESQDFGFQVENHYTLALAQSLTSIAPGQLGAVYDRMQDALRRIPGVTNAAFSLYGPMSGDNWSSTIVVDGHDTSERLVASWNRVSPGYFDTIGIPLRRGRAVDARDRPGTPLVAVVSDTFASRFFPGGDPIGRRIGFSPSRGGGSADIEIVGVVGDAKYQDGREEPHATFYLPFLQSGAVSGATGVVARLDRSHYPQAIELQTSGPISALEPTVREALHGVDRRITIRGLLPMEEQIAQQFNLERLIARLSASFGLVALLLACLGLYGVTAYSVSRRTREIGIRMAVGASRPMVLRTVLTGALLQLAVGVAIGLPAALVAGHYLQAQLFGVSAHDPLVMAGTLALLAVCAVLAAVIPGRRAASLDPVRALRLE